MSVVSTPAYIQALSHPADVFRRAIQAVARGGYGVVVAATDLQVSQNGTPNMSVNVAAGQCVLPNTQNTTYGGVYSGALNDATVNLTIAASDPTNPRIDLIVAQVEDAAYSGGNNDWKLAVVTGTPAASPSPPTAPANSISLAQVRVNANVTSITSGVITDVRPSLASTAQLAGQLLQSTGLTGAQAVSRLVGAVNGAAPASGSFNTGDFVLDLAGLLRLCTAGGSPGTWMPSGLPRIAETIISSSTASINFSSIPQTFRHLLLMTGSVNSDQSASQNLVGQFNGDSATDYATWRLTCNTGGTTATASVNPSNGCYLGSVASLTGAPSLATANSFALIFDYTQTLRRITTLALWVQDDGTGTWAVNGGDWKPGTLAAVTSLLVAASAGNITNGRFGLYGIA